MSSFHLLLIFGIYFACFMARLNAEDKEKCAKELSDWCHKNNNNTEGDGISEATFVYGTFVNGTLTRIYCTVDNEGTECLKNKQPWFDCFPNKTLVYEGRDLTNNSEVDDAICLARNISAYIDNNFGFNQTGINQQMINFQEEMYRFQRQFEIEMENFQRRMAGMFGDFMGNNSDY